MKAAELRQKSREDLDALLKEKLQHADELLFLLHGKKIKNVKELAHTRKDIARILTLLKEAKGWEKKK